MGYDCTLHLIDENRIRQRFVDRLLDPTLSGDSFDRREDAAELWSEVRSALEGDDAAEAAGLVAQLALLFTAAELPYHYERGFCLSLWPDQPAGCDAEIPKRFVGDPEDLFERLIDRHPDLRGHFPRTIESNFCTGIYVPTERVPSLLNWVTKRTDACAADEAFILRGLLLLLEQAVERRLAYWEATDLPLEMQTIRPAVQVLRLTLTDRNIR